MATIEVYSPVAVTRVRAGNMASRVGSLEGKRVGWLGNLKANAAGLLESVSRELERRGMAFNSIAQSKDATAAAPSAVMSHLQSCDAVVLAIAD